MENIYNAVVLALAYGALAHQNANVLAPINIPVARMVLLALERNVDQNI